MIAQRIKDLVMTKSFLFLTGILILLITAHVIMSYYIVINKSSSLPGHVYLINHSRDYKLNSIILFCPDEKLTRLEDALNNSVKSSRCPTGVNPLLKTVSALPYDYIQADGENNLIINNQVIRNSKPGVKIPLPKWRFEGLLPKDNLLVLTSNPDSLDSRYYGPISTDQIISTVTELF